MSEHFFCSSLSNIKSSEWNECVGNDHPFLQYEFLHALEKSNSANTCLLYTSPSPRDRQKYRMPSSA